MLQIYLYEFFFGRKICSRRVDGDFGGIPVPYEVRLTFKTYHFGVDGCTRDAKKQFGCQKNKEPRRFGDIMGFFK